MRHQARTRRGGGIPPTKHRDANGGCSAREESSFSPKRETSMRRLAPAPEGATRGHGRGLAERTEAGRGELCRTRPRSRICIRRAGRRTHKSPTLHREHGCPDRDRTLEGKHTSKHCAEKQLHCLTRARRKYQAWSLPMNSQGAFFARSPPRKRMP